MASNKEKPAAQMMEKVHARDLCDDRDAASCVNASSLPNGAFGMVLLSVKGSDLLISDADIQSTPGDLLYTIPPCRGP